MLHIFATISNGYVTVFDEAAGFAPLPVSYDDDGNVTGTEQHPAIPEDAIELATANVETVRSNDGPFVMVGDAVVPFSLVPDWRPPDATISKDALIAYAADKRWQVETAGINVGGVDVATDDRSKLMIIGARIKADADENFTTTWKIITGEFVTIDAATIIAVSNAVLAHVDGCFAAEMAVLTAIDAETITTFAEIDAADWPS